MAALWRGRHEPTFPPALDMRGHLAKRDLAHTTQKSIQLLQDVGKVGDEYSASQGSLGAFVGWRSVVTQGASCVTLSKRVEIRGVFQ